MRTMLPPSAVGTRLGATALTVLTAAGATWLATPTAVAAPGTDDIRIHDERTPYGSAQDDLEVCKFHLEAVGFDNTLGTRGSYTITAVATPSTVVTTGPITLNSNGAGQSTTLGLVDGQ